MGVDFVQIMQSGGDLQDAWVTHYTTFACDIYDSRYCKIMIIALCDMMSEIHDAQAYLRHGFNDIIVGHSLSQRQLQGFMADSVESNWNFICEIYGLVTK